MSRLVAGVLALALAGGPRAQTPDAGATAQPTPAPSSAVSAPDPEAQADFQRRWVTPNPSPTLRLGAYASATLYGGERLDLINDSTQSFGWAANNDTLQTPTSYRGSHGQTTPTASNARFGLKVGSPVTTEPFGWLVLGEIGASRRPQGGGEGWQSPTAHFLYVSGRTPIIDVLVGRYHDLFGWGGKGFFPNTVATLGVPGEVFRQRGQVRLSHVFRWRPVDFEIALAGVAPVQNVARAAEGQLGLRLAVNGWVGAGAQAAGPAEARPLQVGISSVARRLEINPFSAMPGSPIETSGGGLALDAFVPIIPAHGDDLGNGLSLNVELTGGSGIADLYPGLTGGATLPALPNPAQVLPAPVIYASLPASIATFDANGDPHTINWRSLVLGVQYHLPVSNGRRVWVSATWSRTTSNNLASLTPPLVRGFVWTDARYADANVFVAIWRGLQAALSVQVTRQTLDNGVTAENRRGQVAVSYYF
jgi:hypothetical protein